MMDAEIDWFPDPVAARAGAVDRVPLKRFATAEEIAELVLFVGTRATFATGSCFSADGGTTAG
jgi:NAD(P)-dependent dehydrogenase (short-subunit alcohol dehydrogenase family)